MSPRTPLQRLTAAVLATLLGLSVLAGCSSDSEPKADAAPATTTEAPTTAAEPTTTTLPPLDPDMAYVATSTVQGNQTVYTEPSDDAEPHPGTFPNPWLGTSPLIFLVEERVDADWWKVYLPTRPNGSTGYVKASEVDVTPNPYRIEVYLSDFRLVAYNEDEVILDTQVAVAADNTPTPGGLYYITELRGEFPPTNDYGTYAYGLSGFSDVHQTFNGGPGQLGIHGTNKPELIGQQVSNGCIRMRNEDIEQLVPLLPLGVPVEVIV
jgi:lipoprotein-anchoring transpeptidase ErfK/SrfK